MILMHEALDSLVPPNGTVAVASLMCFWTHEKKTFFS